MENDFLPNGYEPPVSNSRYMKFADGDNQFRVLSSAIVGWLDWDDKTPVRTKEEPEAPINPKQPVKHFWAFAVWDYTGQEVKILEITQVGIRKAIMALVKNKDWGDPKGYDIVVNKTGQKLDTEYTVTPVPHKPLSEEIKSEYEKVSINLEKLFENGDPFANDNQERTAEQIANEQAEIDAEKTKGVDVDKVPMA